MSCTILLEVHNYYITMNTSFCYILVLQSITMSVIPTTERDTHLIFSSTKFLIIIISTTILVIITVTIIVAIIIIITIIRTIKRSQQSIYRPIYDILMYNIFV